MHKYLNLQPGDPAPNFVQRSASNPRFAFDTAAGRNIVLCFVGSTVNAHSRAALEAAAARRDIFNDQQASFFVVTSDPRDEAEKRIGAILPGYRTFWDFDQKIARLYGVAPHDAGANGYVGKWVMVDPTMHVAAVIPFRADGGDIPEALDYAAAMPAAGQIAGMQVQAPVIVMERVFEPAFCQYLMDVYDAQDRDLSGFMRDVDGKTHLVHDASHKRRRDCMLESADDQMKVQRLIQRRIVPEIAKVHHFAVTRIERFLVACYAAEDEAHFRPHRDNTTRGTAHRRFAVSINLNDDFDGGEIRFPEYGARGFKPSKGSAVIFSCSLLHAVTQVTRGRRYAFLPFLYDDAAAQVRDTNLAFLASSEPRGSP